MESFALIKLLHMGCAALSITGFVARAVMKLIDSPLLRKRWLRIAPHGVDTVLLLSAIWLALESRQYPLQDDWLTAKVIALLCYIGLGFCVLRFAQNHRQRLLALLLALGSFAYIVLIAISRHALPWQGFGN